MAKYSSPITPKYFKDTSMPRKAVGSLLRKSWPFSQYNTKKETSTPPESKSVVPTSAKPVDAGFADVPRSREEILNVVNRVMNTPLPNKQELFFKPTESSRASSKTSRTPRTVRGEVSTGALLSRRERLEAELEQLNQQARNVSISNRIKNINTELKLIDYAISDREGKTRIQFMSPSKRKSLAPYQPQKNQKTSNVTASNVADVSAFSSANAKAWNPSSGKPYDEERLPTVKEMQKELEKTQNQLEKLTLDAQRVRSASSRAREFPDVLEMDVGDEFDFFDESERISNQINQLRSKQNAIIRQIRGAENNPWYMANQGKTVRIERQPYAEVYRSPRDQGLRDERPPRQDVEPSAKSKKPYDKEYVSERLTNYENYNKTLQSVENEVDRLFEQDTPESNRRATELLNRRESIKQQLNTELYAIDELRRNSSLIEDKTLRSKVERITDKPVTSRPKPIETRTTTQTTAQPPSARLQAVEQKVDELIRQDTPEANQKASQLLNQRDAIRQQNDQVASRSIARFNENTLKVEEINNKIDEEMGRFIQTNSVKSLQQVKILERERDRVQERIDADATRIKQFQKNPSTIGNPEIRQAVQQVRIGGTRPPVTIPKGAKPATETTKKPSVSDSAQVSASTATNPRYRVQPDTFNARTAMALAQQQRRIDDAQARITPSSTTTGKPATTGTAGKPATTGTTSKPATTVAESRARVRPQNKATDTLTQQLATRSYKSASYLDERSLEILAQKPEVRDAFFRNNPDLLFQLRAEADATPKGERRNVLDTILLEELQPVKRVFPSSTSGESKPKTSATSSKEKFIIPLTAVPRDTSSSGSVTPASPVRPRKPVVTADVSSPSAKYNRTGTSMSDPYSRYFENLVRASSFKPTPRNQALLAYNQLMSGAPDVDYDAVLRQAQSRKASKQKAMTIREQLMLERLLNSSPDAFDQIRREVFGTKGKYRPSSNERYETRTQVTTPPATPSTKPSSAPPATPSRKPVNPEMTMLEELLMENPPETKPTTRIRTTITVPPEGDASSSTSKPVTVFNYDAPIGPETTKPTDSKPRRGGKHGLRLFNPGARVVYDQTKQEGARIKRAKPSEGYTITSREAKDIKSKQPKIKVDDFVEIRPSSGGYTNMKDVKDAWENQVMKPLRSLKDPRQGKLNALSAAKEGVGETLRAIKNTPAIRVASAPIRGFRRLPRAGKIAVGGGLILGAVKLADMMFGALPRAESSTSSTSSKPPKEAEPIYSWDFNKRMSKSMKKSAYSNSMMKSSKKISKNTPAPHASKNVNRKQAEHYTSNGVRVSNKYF